MYVYICVYVYLCMYVYMYVCMYDVCVLGVIDYVNNLFLLAYLP